MLLAGVLVLAQCSPQHVRQEERSPRELMSQIADIETARIQPEIEKAAGDIKAGPEPKAIIMEHLRLALLYSHYRNPSPDYPRALKELDQYLLLVPDGAGTSEVRDRHALLKEINRLGGESETLNDTIKQLKKEAARLGKENKSIREKLSQLEALDIEFEKKRKQVR
ncbi:MAG: hypothetical protein EPN25_01205 [Nitrospirae bacterium]|nr:MAG: hypothetical protein EPN25_01205 [Nitrospirota bacterium]